MRRKPLATLNDTIGESIDLLVCSASYESRCKSVATSIDSAKIGRVLIAQNINHAQFFVENADYLKDLFGAKCSFVDLNTNYPVFGADNLNAILENVLSGRPRSVLVDITTFTHEALLILVQLMLLRARHDDRIQFVYVGAEEYSIGLPLEEKWLSKGTKEIRSVLGYPGIVLPSRKIHLIVLVGFETERARSLIDAYEPSLLSLGYSPESASITKTNFVANEYFHSKATELYPRSQTFIFPANDILGTKAVLEERIGGSPGYNVVVAPMNTKLSAIGSALVAIENEAVQVCYAQAELYNYSGYSSPSEWCYLFSLPAVRA
jgi:hypothetical protein